MLLQVSLLAALLSAPSTPKLQFLNQFTIIKAKCVSTSEPYRRLFESEFQVSEIDFNCSDFHNKKFKFLYKSAEPVSGSDDHSLFSLSKFVTGDYSYFIVKVFDKKFDVMSDPTVLSEKICSNPQAIVHKITLNEYQVGIHDFPSEADTILNVQTVLASFKLRNQVELDKHIREMSSSKNKFILEHISWINSKYDRK